MDATMDESDYVDILDANKKIATRLAWIAKRKAEGKDVESLIIKEYTALRLNYSFCHYRKHTGSEGLNTNLSCNSLASISSIHQHKVLQPTVELRISFLKSVVENLTRCDSCVEKIAGILFRAECRLSDVICLQNVELTRSFLIEQDSISNEDFYKEDSLTTVDRVMSFLDLEHTEIVLKYGPHKDIKIRRFFRNLVSMAMQHFNLEALELFVEQIAKWNILDKETCMLLEQEVYFKAGKEVIQIFLQSGLHNHIDKVFGINVLVALFGNPNIKIGFLKRRKFNVNARGSNDSTALHYATKSKSLKKVKYLLDRGVDPNSMTSKCVTALNLALCEPNVNPIENEKCAELLLQYGADPLLLTSEWLITECCMMPKSFKPPYSSYVSIGYLSKLTLAYLSIYEAAGTRKVRLRGQTHREFEYSMRDLKIINDEDNLQNFHSKCQQELEMLKKHEIRKNLTMFTILYETERKLIRLVNEQDCKIIDDSIEIYCKKKTLNCYYLRALREHMRQVRKLIEHKNRALFVISRSNLILAPYFLVLEQIVSFLTYKDLLMFQ